MKEGVLMHNDWLLMKYVNRFVWYLAEIGRLRLINPELLISLTLDERVSIMMYAYIVEKKYIPKRFWRPKK